MSDSLGRQSHLHFLPDRVVAFVSIDCPAFLQLAWSLATLTRPRFVVFPVAVTVSDLIAIGRGLGTSASVLYCYTLLRRVTAQQHHTPWIVVQPAVIVEGRFAPALLGPLEPRGD